MNESWLDHELEMLIYVCTNPISFDPSSDNYWRKLVDPSSDSYWRKLIKEEGEKEELCVDTEVGADKFLEE